MGKPRKVQQCNYDDGRVTYTIQLAFNWLKTIGKHMECTGLDDVWVEADVLAEITSEAVMQSKQYHRAVSHSFAFIEANFKNG